MEARKLSFSVASYNVLASAFIQRARYPRTPALVLEPTWRVPALAQHISALASDILCLQEVEADVLSTLKSRLSRHGHAGLYARKYGGSLDGCAIFYRRDFLEPMIENVIRFADGEEAESDAGNIALITIFSAAGRRLGIINTHLSWDPPGTARECQRGLRQARQLLLEYKKTAASADAWIIAGDLNVTPSGEIVSLIEGSGFRCAHGGAPPSNTYSLNGEAKKIDYLFHSPNLRSDPYKTHAVDGQTVLPSTEQPSDHIAVGARFHWKN
jgi:mRNA deadenylase 3'-5' endonuclease subunit Ccr4